MCQLKTRQDPIQVCVAVVMKLSVPYQMEKFLDWSSSHQFPSDNWSHWSIKIGSFIWLVSWDSWVSAVTRLQGGISRNWVSVSGNGKILSLHMRRLVLDPAEHPVGEGATVSCCLELKRPGCEAAHSPPSNTTIKPTYNWCVPSPCARMSLCLIKHGDSVVFWSIIHVIPFEDGGCSFCEFTERERERECVCVFLCLYMFACLCVFLYCLCVHVCFCVVYVCLFVCVPNCMMSYPRR
jgi:hypothetical protein